MSSIYKHSGFLSDDNRQLLTKRARQVLCDYYCTHGLDEFQAVSDMLTTLQDHGVSPKELPIMDEMREIILRR